MRNADAIVIGGGIAGASVAAELSAEMRVILVEQETQAGFHATSRSAAVIADYHRRLRAPHLGH